MNDRIRAEPGKHRLDDGFIRWTKETIEANKKTGGLEKNAQKTEQGATNLLWARH